MRPTEFSETQIIEAGHKLEAEGRRVTGFALRKLVGGGNASRLTECWEAHKQSYKLVEAEPVQELPVEVQDVLDAMTADFVSQFKNLVVSLNNKAVRTAERRVSEVIKAAREEQAKAEAELTDAEIAVEELDAHNDKTQQELKEALATIESQKKDIANISQQLAVMNEKYKALSTQLTQEKNENTRLISLCEKESKKAAQCEEKATLIQIERARLESDLLHSKQEKELLINEHEKTITLLEKQHEKVVKHLTGK